MRESAREWCEPSLPASRSLCLPTHSHDVPIQGGGFTIQWGGGARSLLSKHAFCYTLLRTVPNYSPLFPTVPHCSPLFPTVAPRHAPISTVTHCHEPLQHSVTSRALTLEQAGERPVDGGEVLLIEAVVAQCGSLGPLDPRGGVGVVLIEAKPTNGPPETGGQVGERKEDGEQLRGVTACNSV